MGNIVTVEDVAASYEGEIPDEQREWVGQKIAEAQRILYAQCPAAKARASIDSEFFLLVKDCVVRAVLRVVRDESPMYRSETEGNYSYSKNMLVASGDIWFPDKELAFLGCNARTKVGGTRLRMSAPYGYPSRVARGVKWY
ncbi:Gp19/Gp15/Gp42 family protein [Rothia sp. CCM 9417]|uniref:Gp19/Gp15/Gp42 family protein n=1 Tax=Rothia sp. CCM 9417 TaxID=3402657 RepID=UPI003ADA2C29